MWNNTNRQVENKIYRRKVANLTGGCDRCRPHRGENHEREPRRSWKFTSRRDRQFKGGANA